MSYKNIEKQRKYDKEWRKKHTNYMREWRKNNPNYDKELAKKHPEWVIKRKEWRHQTGISKKYISAPRYSGTGISYTKEYKKLSKQRCKAMRRNNGTLSIKTIQLVYEDNIKKFGTLTCIYCLQSILFGKDTLEHKTPLSRGGNNEYENLAIACKKCNFSKGKKTEEEYRKE